MDGITSRQRDALSALAPSLDEGTYLAGGVAVALELRHRASFDLDLFVPHDFDADRAAERISARAPVRIVGRAKATLHAEIDGVPVSLLSYRYPLVAPSRTGWGLPVAVASLEDLACMKVSAVAGRGAAKDFWDLSSLLAHGVGDGDLAAVMDLFRKKYPADDVGHAVRSLAYFGDADAAPLPRGLTAEHWASIKRDIADRVQRLD